MQAASAIMRGPQCGPHPVDLLCYLCALAASRENLIELAIGG